MVAIPNGLAAFFDRWLRPQVQQAADARAPAQAAGGAEPRGASDAAPGARGFSTEDRFERPAAAARVAPADSAGHEAPTSPLAAPLNRGYQYLIGNDFPTSARALQRSGSQGVAILDREGATPAGVADLRARGVVPLAYNNAFQLQEGERPPNGVRIVDRDGQWNEGVPDFKSPAWQARRIGEAIDVAKQGFGGVMLDNVPRAGTSREAADYVAKMVRDARQASGNPNFTAVLQNGDALVKAHPWLVDQGLVGAVQKEDVSFRVRGKGSGAGVPVGSEEAAQTEATFRELRTRHPKLPLIAVDYPATARQAEAARERAKSFGFNVSHQALGDGSLQHISGETRVVTPAAVD